VTSLIYRNINGRLLHPITASRSWICNQRDDGEKDQQGRIDHSRFGAKVSNLLFHGDAAQADADEEISGLLER
jgi:hypothetical protein